MNLFERYASDFCECHLSTESDTVQTEQASKQPDNIHGIIGNKLKIDAKSV